ncbi:haloacid dehalogenase type II [Bauldia litoralis]|uniref:(S)-2-haloacid dehalogenase n=1 Tax=Bauldia litoralis TaxID=665467 RepID=A0A1G6BBP9_9HYPH|nr:haloacid dehalogenase type II [Bauldia litoralis]SDB18037.1 2-haloacid dehalogenase [Bauldia litoralis]
MTIRAYVFDAYGTLFDVHAAVRRHAGAIGPQSQRLSDIWRTKQLEYTWVRSLMGRYRDFWSLTEEALDFAIAAAAPDAASLKPDLLDAYRELEAYPEVRGVLTRLKASAKLAILSNGSPEMLDTAVASAGIGDLLDEIISVDALQIYKTAPSVYDLVGERMGVPPEAVSFQSSNRWDIAGATAYGFRTVWINRTGQPDEYPDLPPVAVMSSLEGLGE